MKSFFNSYSGRVRPKSAALLSLALALLLGLSACSSAPAKNTTSPAAAAATSAKSAAKSSATTAAVSSEKAPSAATTEAAVKIPKSKADLPADAPKLTLILDWTPNTNHTGLFMAEADGAFLKEGLDVTIEDAPEGSTTSLVGAGKAQFGISFQDTLAAAFTSDSPVPVTAIAAICQHNSSGIISLKSRGITRPRDMAGHNYATWSNPVEQAMLRQVVKDDGGDPDKVEMLPAVPENILQAIQGDIDCIWAFYGWDGIASTIQGPPCNFFFFKDYGKQFDYYTPVIIANNDFLRDHKDIALRFMRAVSAGYTHAAEDPEAAYELMHKKLPELDPAVLQASQAYLSKLYIDDAPQFGYIDKERWNAFYRWLNEKQLLPKALDENFGFSNDYLPAAN